MTTPGYLLLDGVNDYVTTPHHASIDLLGSMDLRVAPALDNWTAAGDDNLIEKGVGGSSGFVFHVRNGKLAFTKAGTFTQESSSNPPATNGLMLPVRVKVVADNGAGSHVITFYWKADDGGALLTQLKSNAGWTQLSTHTRAGVLTLTGTGVEMSLARGNWWSGKLYAAVVMDATNVVVADPDFTNLAAAATSHTDTTGKVWTFFGNPTIVQQVVPPPPRTPIGAEVFIDMDFTNQPSQTPAWTDISSYVRGMEIRRGSQQALGRIEAGTLHLIMDNRDRRFDPLNASSPYYPNVLPMCRVRVRAIYNSITYPLFTGYVDGWDQGWRAHSDAFVDVSATDGFKVLANFDLPGSVWELEVRKDAPTYWWRFNDEERSQEVRNAMDPDVGRGSYLPLARPPAHSESLNLYDDDRSMYCNAKIGFDEGGDPKGQYARIPVTLTSPFTFTTVFMADVDKVRIDQTSGEATVMRYGIDLNVGTKLAAGNIWVELLLYTSYKPLGTQTAQLGDVLFRVGVVANDAVDRVGGVIADQNHLDRKPHILTATFDGRYGRFFRDGVLLETDDYTTGLVFPAAKSGDLLVGTSSDFFVGQPANESGGGDRRPWHGWFDDTIIYPTALSDARVIALHEALTDPWKGDRSDARITRILDYIGWPAADRDIGTGTGIGVAVLGRATRLGGRALEYIADVVGSEHGRFFMTADGKARFLNRHAVYQPPLSTVQATFGDGGGSELPYFDLKLEYNDANIINEAVITREEGEPQRAFDGTVSPPTGSQGRYLKRLVEFTTMHDRDSEPKAMTEWLVYENKDAHQRVRELRVRPQHDPATLFPQVLGRDIGHRLKVRRRPPPDRVMFEEEVIVEGVQHVITPAAWETTWWLSSADTADVLVINDPVYSILGNWRAPL